MTHHPRWWSTEPYGSFDPAVLALREAMPTWNPPGRPDPRLDDYRGGHPESYREVFLWRLGITIGMLWPLVAVAIYGLGHGLGIWP
jgi:hypothetical protein